MLDPFIVSKHPEKPRNPIQNQRGTAGTNKLSESDINGARFHSSCRKLETHSPFETGGVISWDSRYFITIYLWLWHVRFSSQGLSRLFAIVAGNRSNGNRTTKNNKSASNKEHDKTKQTRTIVDCRPSLQNGLVQSTAVI